VFVCCECCVLSGRGLCDELITRPEESYRLWCVVCDLETSRMRRLLPTGGLLCQNQTPVSYYRISAEFIGTVAEMYKVYRAWTFCKFMTSRLVYEC
jgi:hypothetical protein